MKKFCVLLLIFVFAIAIFGQKEQPTKDKEKEKTSVSEIKSIEPMDLAKLALAALGGDKFKNIKTLSIGDSRCFRVRRPRSYPRHLR